MPIADFLQAIFSNPNPAQAQNPGVGADLSSSLQQASQQAASTPGGLGGDQLQALALQALQPPPKPPEDTWSDTGKKLMKPLAFGLLNSLIYPKLSGPLGGIKQGISAGLGEWSRERDIEAQSQLKLQDNRSKAASTIARLAQAKSTQESKAAQFQELMGLNQQKLELAQQIAESRDAQMTAKLKEQEWAVQQQMSRLVETLTTRRDIANLYESGRDQRAQSSEAEKQREFDQKQQRDREKFEFSKEQKVRETELKEQHQKMLEDWNETRKPEVLAKVEKTKTEIEKIQHQEEARTNLAERLRSSGDPKDADLADKIEAGMPFKDPSAVGGTLGKNMRKVEYWDPQTGHVYQDWKLPSELSGNPTYQNPGGTEGKKKEEETQNISVVRGQLATIANDISSMPPGTPILNAIDYGKYKLGGGSEKYLSGDAARRVTDIKNAEVNLTGVAQKMMGIRASSLIQNISPHFPKVWDSPELIRDKKDRIELAMDLAADAMGWKGGIQNPQRLEKMKSLIGMPQVSAENSGDALSKMGQYLSKMEKEGKKVSDLDKGSAPTQASGAQAQPQAQGLSPEQARHLQEKWGIKAEIPAPQPQAQ